MFRFNSGNTNTGHIGSKSYSVDRWKPFGNSNKKSYEQRLKEFMNTECYGKEYDSCEDSLCEYKSDKRCTHPNHPHNEIIYD